MKYFLAQIALRLPDDFDLSKADLNRALEDFIIHRMVRNRTCKSPKAKPRYLKDWKPMKDFFGDFWEDAGKSDRKIAAAFGFGTVADPPKPAVRKPRRR